VKDRCILLTDFWHQAHFFYEMPEVIDIESILPKWNDVKNLFFGELTRTYTLSNSWNAPDLEHSFKEIAAVNRMKPGELMLPFRIMLVGAKYGPGVFEIAALLGKEETLKRIHHTLSLLSENTTANS
ncbi:MAG: glutamate--tRNA ligase, partial [Bacteroidota bacterium]|nr:glutamate--tRNA ligase [Bacteroidota bacterium]